MSDGIQQKYKDSYIKLELSNVEVWFPHFINPDTEFGNNKWSAELHLSDELAAQLKAEGFNVKDKTLKDGTVIKNVLKVKREKVLKSGQTQDPPYVVGPDGVTPFTREPSNGCICNLHLSAKAWPIRGEWQLSLYLDGVQVVSEPGGSRSFSSVEENKEDVPF